MMAGNPTNWWSMMANAGTVHPPHHHSSSSSSSPSYQLSPPSSSSHHFYAPSDSMPENPAAQDFPRSWSQLLLGGAENEKFGMSPFQYKRMVQETWEDQIINGNNNNNNNPSSSSSSTAPVVVDVIKHEDHFPQIGHLYGHNHHPPPLLPLVLENDHHQYFQQTAAAAAPRPLPHHHHHHQEFASSSSPRSCVTTAFRDSAGNNNNNNNNNVLIFSGNRSCPKPPEAIVNTHHSSQCNSTSTSSGGAPKKARVHQSSTQSSLKVRKEKLGDRITALHQLVSPFGKLHHVVPIPTWYQSGEAATPPLLSTPENRIKERFIAHLRSNRRGPINPHYRGLLPQRVATKPTPPVRLLRRVAISPRIANQSDCYAE